MSDALGVLGCGVVYDNDWAFCQDVGLLERRSELEVVVEGWGVFRRETDKDVYRFTVRSAVTLRVFDTAEQRELAHRSDKSDIFPLSPIEARRAALNPVKHHRLEAAELRAWRLFGADVMPFLEAALAAQGDAPDGKLLSLQHSLAELLRSPANSSSEQTIHP